MTQFKLLLPISVLILFSCQNSENKKLPQVEMPNSLKVEPSYDLVSKRSYDDLVESLYQDQVEKTPELKALETRINALSKGKNDSTETYRNFENKNQSYYASTNYHIDQISDSILKQKMKSLIAGSLKNYTNSILPQNQLLQSIETKTISLNDLHTVLKITLTLAVMEKYQKENLPDSKPIENYSKELDGTIKETEKLIKY